MTDQLSEPTETVNTSLADSRQRILRFEIRDLSSRLYYCSDSGEGRKVRREFEAKIRKLEKELAKIEAA